MREYMLTFLSDNVDKMKVFDALHSSGLRAFVVTEMQTCDYENWKQTVDAEECPGTTECEEANCVECNMAVSENSTVSKKEKVKTCADCKYFGFSTVFSRTSETQYLCTLKSEDEKRYVTSVCVGFEVREDEYKQQICEEKPSEQGE